MWKIKVSPEKEEETVHRLNEAGLYSFFIQEAICVTKDFDGYSYIKDTEGNQLLFIDDQAHPEASIIAEVLGIQKEEIDWEVPDTVVEEYQDMVIADGWELQYPPFENRHDKSILLDPQGAFGTGLHGTTTDMLTIIAEEEPAPGTVLDAGTGSGVLALGAALRGAEVDAFDIQPVAREVRSHAALNGVEKQIRVHEKDLLAEAPPRSIYDWIVVNIGASFSIEVLDYLKKHNIRFHKLAVSGVVEWSVDAVEQAYRLDGLEKEKHKVSGEWHTMLWKKRGV